MSRTEITPGQFTALRRGLQEREAEIIERMLQQPDYPPLPPCPECGAEVEQIDSMVEPPSFGLPEQAFLINVKPCGHRLRAVVDLDEPT
ncbi:hypothetical protein [Streptomyces tendae]|uniref:hypothetical protein n=1 Tax=Streptomyces tendae TaxID=1932 RepID=UPI0024917FF1|nr:hypothetical protein [Streptomyces tendae]